tara:strand:- start:132 stop:419 length:288 start_codon:yes stop_codon:yes gene_type:complete
MADLTITINLDDTEENILLSHLPEIDAWIAKEANAKIENCWKRMQREWSVKLTNDASFTDGIPSDKSKFIKLVTERSDYKDRAAREKAYADAGGE